MPCPFADLAADPSVMAVHLDAAKAALFHCLLQEDADAAAVINGMYAGEAGETTGSTRNDVGDAAIGNPIIGVKDREQDGFGNSGVACPSQIPIQRSGCVIRSGESISFTCVAMAIDDHEASPRRSAQLVHR